MEVFNATKRKCKLLFIHNDMNEFINQLQRDERKRKYCKEYNINLLEIDGRKHNHRNVTVEKIKKDVATLP